MTKIQALDGWRGIAILAVIFGHFATSKGINLGRVGVELFFVLSGRLMADLLFVKQNDLIVFLKRRVSRVWPALFAMVLIVAWVAAVPAKGVIYALTFTSNYASAFGYRVPVLDHLWSLCIEEHTYLLLAALAFVVRRTNAKPEPACLLLALFCMAHGVYLTLMGGDYNEVYWRTDTRAASILLSCAIYLYMRGKHFEFPAWGIVALGCAGCALSLNLVPDPIKYTLGTLCFALAISSIETASGFVQSVLSSRLLGFVGLLSYSLYLWQEPFYKMIGTYPRLALLAAAVACAFASFHIIEQPARNYLNRKWAKRKLAAKEVEAAA